MRLALFLHDSTNNYQLLMREDALRTSRRHGHTVTVHSADADTETQVRQIHSALAEGPDARPAAVLVSPVRESALLGAAREALGKGVAWVFLCRLTDAVRELRAQYPGVPAFSIGADQTGIGRVQGKLLNVLLRANDEIVYIQGPMGTSSADLRLAATESELADADRRKWSRFRGNWSAEDGFAAMNQWLEIFGRRSPPGFVVAAQNDDMASGARRALTEHVHAGRSVGADLRIIGCDGVPTFGHRLVTEGELTATVVVPSVAGRAIEEVAAACAQGRQPQAHVLVEVQSLPDLESLARRAPRPLIR